MLVGRLCGSRPPRSSRGRCPGPVGVGGWGPHQAGGGDRLSFVSSVALQAAQIVLLLVAAFTICWMPHHIIAMWVEFGRFPLNDASFVFRIVSHCLSYGNSCVNPILYAFLSENFRRARHQVFTCHFLFPPPPSNKATRCRMENCSTTHS